MPLAYFAYFLPPLLVFLTITFSWMGYSRDHARLRRLGSGLAMAVGVWGIIGILLGSVLSSIGTVMIGILCYRLATKPNPRARFRRGEGRLHGRSAFD
ncbi:MAG: hypothetical protein AAFR61_09320 [Bacteroidota bacterium]